MRFTVSRPPFSALAALVPSGRLIVATVATALVASLSLAFSTPATISVDGQRLASDVAGVENASDSEATRAVATVATISRPLGTSAARALNGGRLTVNLMDVVRVL